MLAMPYGKVSIISSVMRYTYRHERKGTGGFRNLELQKTINETSNFLPVAARSASVTG